MHTPPPSEGAKALETTGTPTLATSPPGSGADTLVNSPATSPSSTVSTQPARVSVKGEKGDGELVGLILGERYAIEERLSAGGMGVVYRARHTVLDSPVAVKILRKAQDTEAQRRFLQEAKLASLIRHPNTVYISDFGVLTDGRSYLVMEFLSGPTLGKIMQHSRLPVARACRIALQIAQGLESVHGKGITHRDLKPENIFVLRSDGSSGGAGAGKEYVKIVDFGIAVAAQPGLSLGGEGQGKNKGKAAISGDGELAGSDPSL
jgi:serine/threonine-protein kinase